MNRATATIGLLLVLSSACVVGKTYSEGRPCDDRTPCGPGTVCDTILKRCVAPSKLPISDGPPGPETSPWIDGSLDLVSVDAAPPVDSLIVPDGGCPPTVPLQCGPTCTDPQTSAKHCGKCDTACGAGQRCANGVCVCRGGFDDCDKRAENGCEADLTRDPSNCTACNKSCGSGATCSSNGCKCKNGRFNCDGKWANGCECSLGCSGTQCKSAGCSTKKAWACGKSASLYCATSGACRSCAAKTYNCNGVGKCECTRPCAGTSCGCDPAAAGWCGGTSKYCNTSTNYCATCASGKTNCNQIFTCECSTGCSGTSCKPPPCSTSKAWSCTTSTYRFCSNGTCKSCSSGKRNCNGKYLCECSTNHTYCSGGNCTCTKGYGDCNKTRSSDGCETNLNTSSSNCGSCGKVCNATCASGCRQVCRSGKCTCPSPPCPF